MAEEEVEVIDIHQEIEEILEEEEENTQLSFEKVSLPDVAVFVIDTETTGSQGIPFWYSQNQIIQIAAFNLEENSWYERYTYPGETLDPKFHIPLENQQKHRISKKVLQVEGVPLKEALEGLKAFKQSSAKGRKIVNVAHNASFDYEMIMKSWAEQCDVSHGIGCQEDEEYYFDTLAAFKHFYPEIGKRVHPREAPYKLSNLAKYFLPGLNMDAAHNAIVDTIATSMLFAKFLFPKLGPDFSLWQRFLVCHPLSPGKLIPALYPLIKIDGYSALRVSMLTEVCNQYFSSFHEEEISNLQCPNGMMTAAKIMSYANIKCTYERAHSRKEEEEEEEDQLGYDSFYEICKVVEKLLRSEKFGIYSDKVICSLLCKVCNCTLLDFTLHTYRICGTLPIFPTMPGEPVSYLPLRLHDTEARYIHEVMGCRTISELYAQMKYLDNSRLLEWIQKLNMGLSAPMHLHTLQQHFDNVIKYGG